MFKVLTKKGLSVKGTDRPNKKGPSVVPFHIGLCWDIPRYRLYGAWT